MVSGSTSQQIRDIFKLDHILPFDSQQSLISKICNTCMLQACSAIEIDTHVLWTDVSVKLLC